MFSGVVKAKRKPDFNSVRRIASPEICQDLQFATIVCADVEPDSNSGDVA